METRDHGVGNGLKRGVSKLYTGQAKTPLRLKYKHKTITGGIGHNLPQEAPGAFADAIVEVDGYSK